MGILAGDPNQSPESRPAQEGTVDSALADSCLAEPLSKHERAPELGKNSYIRS